MLQISAMRHKTKRKLKKWLIWSSAVVLFFILLILVFRKPIVTSILNKKIHAFNTSYPATLDIQSFDFSGLTGVNINGISLVPHHQDTLISVQHVSAHLDFWRLLTFTIRLRDLEINTAKCNLIKHGAETNYMFLLQKKDNEPEDTTTSDIDYAGRVSRIFERIFSAVPSSILFTNISVKADLNGNRFGFFLDELAIEDHEFETLMYVNSNGFNTPWMLQGNLDAENWSGRFKLYAPNHRTVVLPYIQQKFGAKVGFDTIQFSFTGTETDEGVTITGDASMNKLLINHYRISPQDVVFNYGFMDFKINIGSNYIELDSASHFVFNKLRFSPYIRYKKEEGRELLLSLNKPFFNAQDLFESLPTGLFTNLEGIQVAGALAYHFKLDVNFDKPDTLIFESQMKQRDFKILQLGPTHFSKINGPFVYTAYEDGVPVRSFEIGPGNPNYRSLAEIPDRLQKSILTSEDGQFFWHRGLREDAFRMAIITNIKKKRFARGGSTISMQLVKNVFLNRNKTVTRKLEEILIVWLIENCNLSSKQRMYEVYLNIIEMAPMKYGVNEGAQFYFGKDVSQLTLSECIFLSSIIPHPKKFKYTFDKQGNLKSYFGSYFRFVSRKMLQYKYITQEEFDALLPIIDLRGPAREQVVPDSLTVEGPQFDIEYQFFPVE